MRPFPLLLALALVAASCGGGAGTVESTSTTVAATTTSATATTTTSIGTTTTSPTTTTTSTTTPTTTSTSRPATTTTTLTNVTDLEPGLFCRDLRPRGYSYAEAVQYWMIEGRPDRMDADRNGIPCETVYPESEVDAYWGESPPTTPEASRRYVVGEPTYFPESQPGAGEHYGSGCAPGTDTLPDGVWFGRIESAAATRIEFDLMCFGPLEPDQDGVGNITNDSSRLRTVSISSSADVHAIAPDGFWELEDYSSWYLDPGEEGFCEPEGCWTVWLYVNGGEVTEIVQIWFA